MPTELPQCTFEPNKLILRLNVTLQADPQAISPVWTACWPSPGK